MGGPFAGDAGGTGGSAAADAGPGYRLPVEPADAVPVT
jgi:hypothetical protein